MIAATTEVFDSFESFSDWYWKRVAAKRREAKEESMQNEELESMLRDMAADGKFCDPSDLRAELMNPNQPVDVMDGYRLTNCKTCKRTLVYSTEDFIAVYADGLTDGPTLCHSCKSKRNARLTAGGDR